VKRLTGRTPDDGPHPEGHVAEGLPAKLGCLPAVVVEIYRAIGVAVDVLFIGSHGTLHVEGP
jgi:hypothetical protein